MIGIAALSTVGGRAALFDAHVAYYGDYSMIKNWYIRTAIYSFILIGTFVYPVLADDQNLAKQS